MPSTDIGPCDDMWGRHVQPLVARYQESLRCTPACSRTLSGLTRHPLGGLEEEECGAPVCCGLLPCSSMNSCIPLNCGAHIRSFHSFSHTSIPRLGTCFFCSALNLCNVVKLIPPPSATISWPCLECPTPWLLTDSVMLLWRKLFEPSASVSSSVEWGDSLLPYGLRAWG